MATSGYFSTNPVGNFYFTFEWNRTGYSSSNNEHYIHYTLTAHNTPGRYRNVYLKNLSILGGSVFYEAGTSENVKQYSEGDIVTEGDIAVKSYNDSGDGYLSVSFEAGVASYPGSNCSGSGEWNLDRIPRYANFTEHYVSGRTSSSLTIKWNADVSVDWIQYSLNGGNWVDTSGMPYTIYGLQSNTQYSIRTRIRRTDSQLWTESGYIYGTTYQQTVASISLSSKTINSITVSSGCNVATSQTLYRIRKSGGGFGIWQKGEMFVNLEPNTEYIVQVEKIGAESGEYGYAEILVRTYDIARVTRCDNFNSDGNPYMEFSNPGGETVTLYLEFAGKHILREGITGSGGYTFQLTEEERQSLYEACWDSNTLSLLYGVETAKSYWDYTGRIMTVVNSNPVFSNCEYKDVGEGSTQLTEAPQIIINGYNKLQVIMSPANKAIAKNGARMSRYRLVCGNHIPVEKPYSEDEEVVLEMSNVTNMTFIVYAIDSRENSTPITKTVTTWKDYFKPVITAGEAERTEQINKEVRLTFSGKIWNDNFGAVENKIVTCKYEYKKTTDKDTDYVTGETEIIPEISGNTFSASMLIKGDAEAEGFELSNAYNIKITINDEIYPATYDVLLNAGKPGMAMHRDGVSFGAPYNEANRGVLQKNGFPVIADHKYYRGSCNDITETCVVYISGGTDCPEELDANYGYLFTKAVNENYIVQTFEDMNSDRTWIRRKLNGTWYEWGSQGVNDSITLVTSRHTQTFATAWTFYEVSNMSVLSKKGTALRANGTGNAIVVIGAGVSKVRVSGGITCNNSTAYDRSIALLKNTAELYNAYLQSTSIYHSLALPPIIVDVIEGDRLSLGLAIGDNNTSSEFLSATITVEVVE